jgi:RsmE family RNA methyltransferase
MAATARWSVAAVNLVLLFDDDFGDEKKLQASAAGQTVDVELTGRRFTHLREVHRAAAGRELTVGRFGGKVGRATVGAIDGERAVLRVTLDRAPPRKLPLTLLLALPRPKTLRRVLQLAATIGVARLVLVNSWRVEKSYWRSPALDADAIREQIVLGLEQGRDTVAPLVETRRLLVPFARDELDALAAGTRRLLAHPDAAAECPRGVGSAGAAAPGAVTLALGPEGGLVERELDLFSRHGFELVTLGERPLRVEQAIAAAIGRLF